MKNRTPQEAARYILELPTTDQTREEIKQIHGIDVPEGFSNRDALRMVYETTDADFGL